MRAVVREDCDASESRSKSSSACVAPIISAAVLGGVNGLLNLRYWPEVAIQMKVQLVQFFSWP
jgi:hypothetical protein